MITAKQLQKALKGVNASVIIDLDIEDCEKVLAEANRPELDPQHKEILQSLVDGKGCVFKVVGIWRWFHRGDTTQFDITIPEMIGLGLLDERKPYGGAGMTEFAIVTDAGLKAIE